MTAQDGRAAIAPGQLWRADDGYLYRILKVTKEWVYARHPNAKSPSATRQIRRAWFNEVGWELVRDAALPNS